MGKENLVIDLFQSASLKGRAFYIPIQFTLVLSIFSIFLVGCAGKTMNLNVSAAASLTDALGEINILYAQEHPEIIITPNFAASGILQKQIQNGAPVDIFISASTTQMDVLQDQQLIIKETRMDLLQNRLVLITPADSKLGLNDFNDLTTSKVKKLAIGDPKFVPAGTYAEDTFKYLGISAQIKPEIILGSDARQVLKYVESGNVDAGIVFFTDAKVSNKVTVAASAPDVINSRILYPAAVIKASRNFAIAKGYEEFLRGTEAKIIFEKYGFNLSKMK
jgi:molybdate transport system substrate-binding protein